MVIFFASSGNEKRGRRRGTFNGFDGFINLSQMINDNNPVVSYLLNLPDDRRCVPRLLFSHHFDMMEDYPG